MAVDTQKLIKPKSTLLIKKKIIKVDKLLERDAVRETRETNRKFRNKQKARRKEREERIEKVKPKTTLTIPKFTMPRAGIGIWDAIKRFITFTFAAWLVGFIKDVEPLVKTALGWLPAIGKTLDWIGKWVIGGIISIIDTTYGAVDWIGKQIENLGGEGAKEKFDQFLDLFKKVINGAIILAMASTFLPKRGGGIRPPGKTPGSKPRGGTGGKAGGGKPQPLTNQGGARARKGKQPTRTTDRGRPEPRTRLQRVFKPGQVTGTTSDRIQQFFTKLNPFRTKAPVSGTKMDRLGQSLRQFNPLDTPASKSMTQGRGDLFKPPPTKPGIAPRPGIRGQAPSLPKSPPTRVVPQSQTPVTGLTKGSTKITGTVDDAFNVVQPRTTNVVEALDEVKPVGSQKPLDPLARKISSIFKNAKSGGQRTPFIKNLTNFVSDLKIPFKFPKWITGWKGNALINALFAGFEFKGRKDAGQSDAQAAAGTGASVAGGMAGFWAGAKIGAATGGTIGAAFFGAGAAPGAFIGGLIGGIAGSMFGANVAGAEVDKLTGVNKEKPKPGSESSLGIFGGTITSSSGGPPHRRALLNTIRWAEGTLKPGGYNTWFGGRTDMDLTKMTIDEVVAEQWRRHNAGETVYGKYKSAAVGAYQMMAPETHLKRAGLTGSDLFSPENQDKLAIAYMKARKITDAEINSPITKGLIAKLSAEWSSLPNLQGVSAHGQPVKSYEDVLKVYNEQLGKAQASVKLNKQLTDLGIPDSHETEISPTQNESGNMSQQTQKPQQTSEEWAQKMIKNAGIGGEPNPGNLATVKPSSPGGVSTGLEIIPTYSMFVNDNYMIQPIITTP